ncbi:MAG: hypothetical protein QOC63_391 [Mycobacterium sp.]|jgi:hypothetical protein|nr:hypothetical protein [Mycobacterium sp.]
MTTESTELEEILSRLPNIELFAIFSARQTNSERRSATRVDHCSWHT